MALSLVTAPVTEPLTLAEAKAHLRVDLDDENALIADLIVAARQTVETFTHRALVTQTWDLRLDGFPWTQQTVHFGAEPIVLPMPPVSSVTSVTYVDTNGVTQTWDSSLYQTDLPSGPWAAPARLFPAYAQWYPVARTQPNAVTVRFVCGYGAPAAVPYPIKAAMKLLVSNWWMNREPAQIIRGSADVLPFGLDMLLWPFKAF